MKIKFHTPFERFSHQSLFYFNVLMTLAFSGIAYLLKGRFDGILDLHFMASVKWYQALVDNLLNISLTAWLLFLAGKLINSKVRLIDVLNAVMLGRVLLYVMLFFNVNNWISRLTDKVMVDFPDIPLDVNLIVLSTFGLFSLSMLVIYLVVMYWGFKVAVNSKKLWHILLFVSTVLLAELLLKLIYYFVEL